MKILMLGWEFPPYFAGGVGMVCYELVKQLTSQGIQVDYVMPFAPDSLNPDFMNLVNASKQVSEKEILTTSSLEIIRVPSLLAAYQTEEEYIETLKEISGGKTTIKTITTDHTRKLYGENLLEEIDLFAKRIRVLLDKGYFQNTDIIHAHDWTTLKAGVLLKRILKKPLIVHVHITDVNKNSGAGVNPVIYEIEREGFFAADKIIAVSFAIKKTLIYEYGVSPEKIEVVHNGGVKMDSAVYEDPKFKGDNKIVSFLGRVTGMKGPEQFIEMAAKVLRFVPKTKFIMGGTGDKLQACIDKTKELGIYDKFYFHGFYDRTDANKFFDLSDVFVLPSHMEPFGVTPLEAMIKDTPTIITHQSGVAEVLEHCFKVDSWNIDKMASQVISLLTYSHLHKQMLTLGKVEAKSLTWDKPADECVKLYEELVI